MVGARPATPADATVVAELRGLAAADLAGKRGGAQAAVAEFDDTAPPVGTGTADAAVVVGCIGDDPVGVASLVRTGPRARLVELFVHPDARGVGVGHTMLQAVEDTARNWGCTDLDSYALPGDRDTKNFFESHAMKSRLLVVHRSL